MLFNSEYLKNLAVPFPDRIIRCILESKAPQAIALNQEMRESRILLHDFFAESCTVLWSFVGERLGEDRVEDMFRYVFAQSAQRQFLDATAAGAPAFLTAIMLAKSWRAHSCFGVGEYPAKFSLTEDDEKFTFHLNPCASGARLWLKGIYQEGRGGCITKKAHPWSYNRKGFPYYCIHCAFMNELLPRESKYGVLMWPVDPLEKSDAPCAWHVYKDPDLAPQSYYDRMGITKKPGPKNCYKPKKGRYFSDSQLKEMARPVTDRIKESIENGNLKAAIELCKDVKDEFLVLHDLYVNMILSTLTFIANEAGEDALGEALERQYEKCIKEQIIDEFKKLDSRGKIDFLANRVFGIDCVNGTGRFPSRFRIKETASEIVFVMSPCGSGGRLLSANAYDSMSRTEKIKENLENMIVRIAASIPLPDSLLTLAFPKIVDSFTQRKPFNQGKIKQARPWSFEKSGVPYYCCQCGMIADKLGFNGLTITPPPNKTSPCVWAFDKEVFSDSSID